MALAAGIIVRLLLLGFARFGYDFPAHAITAASATRESDEWPHKAMIKAQTAEMIERTWYTRFIYEDSS